MAKKKRKKESEIVKKIGTVRLQAFSLIGTLLAKPANMKKLAKAFQEAFNEDPVLFYKLYIRPSAEKELVIQPETGEAPLSFRVIVSDGDGNEEELE